MEPIAQALKKIFGEDQVFYDSWSIQPGDGIIDRMNGALSTCKFFFFFISKNSLTSEMVKMEWQNALMATANSSINFIPVKLDDCVVPTIISQKLYIDIYRNGIDVGIRQIIDVVSGNSTYREEASTFHNLKAYLTPTETSQFDFEIRAEVYLEPASRYVIVSENEDTKVWCTSDSLVMTKKGSLISNQSEKKLYLFYISVNRATSPGFPVRISASDSKMLNVAEVLHATSESDYERLPVVAILPDKMFHFGADVEVPLYEILGTGKSQEEIAEIVSKSISNSLNKKS
ncbi:MAG: TIR domain-containing protein [Atopobiaceae bacterium]|nr:TIR domain-containing protein [Atopobiaceae bacterium]